MASEIDAAELAREYDPALYRTAYDLAEAVITMETPGQAADLVYAALSDGRRALIAALEKAQGEGECHRCEDYAEERATLRAERDSASALLKDILDNAYPGKAFSARIVAELEPKP